MQFSMYTQLQSTAAGWTQLGAKGAMRMSLNPTPSCWITSVRRPNAAIVGVGILQRSNPYLRTLPIAQARAKSDDSSNNTGRYEDVLLKREQQLWERQNGLLDTISKESQNMHATLMDAYSRLQAQSAAEREASARREEALRQENDELRAQLLYALAQLSPGSGNVPSIRSMRGRNDGDILDGMAAAGGLPSPNNNHSSTVPSAEPEVPSTPTGRSSAPIPSSWRSDLAAAIAAVDEVDILSQDIDFSSTSSAKTPSQQTAPQGSPPQPQSQSRAVQEEEPFPPSSVETTEPSGTDDDAPIEIPKGPPPNLAIGADDIFWVNQLHIALVDEGYYPGDDDIEDFYFGESTQSAVMTAQACSGMIDTGLVDDATWAALLGPELRLKQPRDLAATDSDTEGPSQTSSSFTTNNIDSSSSSSGDKKPYAELFSSMVEESSVTGPGGEMQSAASKVSVHDTEIFRDGHMEDNDVTITRQAIPSASGGGVETTSSVSASHKETARMAWPVLMEGDGGRDVHALQVALSNAGYSACDEDERWWQFGSTTLNALKTFQACSGLPESGVTDPKTWKALLGQDAMPGILDSLQSGRSDDEDLGAAHGRVFLIGEQRWADK